MKKLTSTHFTQDTIAAGSAMASAAATFTSFTVPTMPEADWPLAPTLTPVIEQALQEAMSARLPVQEVYDRVVDAITASGASASLDDIHRWVHAFALALS